MEKVTLTATWVEDGRETTREAIGTGDTLSQAFESAVQTLRELGVQKVTR